MTPWKSPPWNWPSKRKPPPRAISSGLSGSTHPVSFCWIASAPAEPGSPPIAEEAGKADAEVRDRYGQRCSKHHERMKHGRAEYHTQRT